MSLTSRINELKRLINWIYKNQKIIFDKLDNHNDNFHDNPTKYITPVMYKNMSPDMVDNIHYFLESRRDISKITKEELVELLLPY